MRKCSLANDEKIIYGRRKASLEGPASLDLARNGANGIRVGLSAQNHPK